MFEEGSAVLLGCSRIVTFWVVEAALTSADVSKVAKEEALPQTQVPAADNLTTVTNSAAKESHAGIEVGSPTMIQVTK